MNHVVQLPTQNALGKGDGVGKGDGKGGDGNGERKVEQREKGLTAMLAQRRVSGVPPSFPT